MATLPGLRVGVTLDSATFIAETRRVDASVNRMGRNVATQSALMQRSFAGVTAAARGMAIGLASAIGAASLSAMVGLGKRALDTAGNLGELAQQAGVTTRQLQVLSVAGTQVGVSQEQLVTALGQFGRRVAEAAQGTGTLHKTLTQYNIAIRNSEGGTRRSVDVLGDLANAVKAASSEQEKLRIAGEAFGTRIGTRLVPLLSEGAEGFQRWADVAEAAGLIISDKLIAQADQASDALATLQVAASTGFQIGVIESFGNAVSSSTDALRQARDAGAAFGQAVGAGLRAAATAAAFVARNWREIVTVGGALVAMKLGAVIAGIAYSMVQLALAIRAGTTAMVVFNAVVGKNIFVLLAKGVLAAVGAIATWMVITREAEGAVEGLADELAAINSLFGEGGVASVELSKGLQATIDKLKLENATLEESIRLYGFFDEASAAIASKIGIENTLRENKISKQEAERIGLLGLLTANEQYKASLEAVQTARAAFEEGQGLQLQIDARGRETEELRVQIALLSVKQKLGDIAVSQVEDEIRATERLRSKLSAVNAARGIADTIEQQKLLLRYGGQETEEYRVQLRLLELKREFGAQTAAELRDQVQLLEQQNTQIEQAANAKRLLDETFNNFLQSVQTSTADVFETIYNGGVKSFSDLFSEAKRLAVKFAAELTTLALFNPRMLLGLGGGAGGLFGGAGTAAAGPISLSQPITGVAAGQAIGAGGSLLPLLGAAGLGGAAGFGIGSSFGGFGGIGGGIGGAAGAGIGFALGGPFGALAGGAIGSLGGGLLGSLFGGGSDKSKGTISGGLGAASGSGKKLGEITGVINQFDQSVANLLNLRQREAVDAALRQFGSVSVNFKGGLTQDVADFAVQQRARAAAQGLGFNPQGIADQNTSAQQALTNIQTALETRRAIEDLTGAVTAFERQTEELEIQFETLTANAKRFGISLDGLADAQRKAEQDLRKAQDAAVSSLLDPFRALSAPLEAFQKELQFQGLSPAAQFKLAQQEFERIASEAQGGSLVAIQQLESAGRLFTQLAAQVGASPAAATATAQVQDVLKSVLGEIADAQRDTGAGFEDAIQRASRNEIDTLKELRDDIVEALRRIERAVK